MKNSKNKFKKNYKIEIKNKRKKRKIKFKRFANCFVYLSVVNGFNFYI